MADPADVTFTLTPQQATDIINNVPRCAPDGNVMPTVFYVLLAQYEAQGGGL